MSLRSLVRQILATGIITPAIELQLNAYLWSQNLEPADLEALEQLVQALFSHQIKLSDPGIQARLEAMLGFELENVSRDALEGLSRQLAGEICQIAAFKPPEEPPDLK